MNLKQKSLDLYKTRQLYKRKKLATAQLVVLSLISFGPKSRKKGKLELVTLLFLPTSFSEKMKLLDKSHNSTIPSSCKVTDLTPARIRFFAIGSKDNIDLISSKITDYKPNTSRMRIKSHIYRHGKKEV